MALKRLLVLRISVVAIYAAAYLGCSDGPSKPTGTAGTDSFKEVATLGVGDTVNYPHEGLKIGFEKTVSDSRCPLDAYCFWAGMARVKLWLLKTNAETATATPAILGTGEDAESIRNLSVTVLGYRISLLELNPYPQNFDPIEPGEYVTTIEVEAIDGERYVPEVEIADLPIDSILFDPYSIDTLQLDGDILTLTAGYSGGCADHDFVLCMSPAAFLESYPVQANLYLRHDSHGDMCEALISEVLEFDLRPVASLFQYYYPGSEGMVYLNVHAFNGEDCTIYRRVLYAF